MQTEEDSYYAERIITDYFVKFALLALTALMLFGLSTVLPREVAFVLTASVLISATLIVAFLALFIVFPKVKLAVIYFERHIKKATITTLLLCLLLAFLALVLLLLAQRVPPF